MSSAPVCVLVGMGPGNGAALARRWTSAGHTVAMVSRNSDALARWEQEIPGTVAFAADAGDPVAATAAYGAIVERFGEVDCLLYNAGPGVWGAFDDVSLQDFETCWRVNSLGLLVATQALVPAMRARGKGRVGITSAGAAWRGRSATTAFASAKAAQRSLAQSLSRTLGPDGVHVALFILDGVVDLPRTRAAMPDKSDDFFMQPDHVARCVWDVLDQPTSTWSFEVNLRPFREGW